MGRATMIVDGPTNTLKDGSVVCIGYGVDSDNRVTGRFALPKGHDWESPDATESIKYVDNLDALPNVHNNYHPQP